MHPSVLTLFFIIGAFATQQTPENHSTELAPEQDDPLLMFATLSGSLVGVGQRSGEIRWRQDDEPAVKVPHSIPETTMPMFLPDPKDGTLYLFGADSEALKKLPFTIPQLVASSPCRSSDGILYTGRKIDTWFSVDPQTGEREQVLGFNKVQNTCPLETQDVIYVGRTEYNIIMIDSKHKDRKWNVTFYDYSAAKMEPDFIDNYDLMHFTTSSTGRVVTWNRRLAVSLWELDLGSPVIAAYVVSKDGLARIPFTSVAEEALDKLLDRDTMKLNDVQLSPTLYIGEHSHGLYALPSFADSSTAKIISSKGARLLLEGPLVTSHISTNKNGIPLPGDHVPSTVIETSDNDFQSMNSEKSIIMLGHYDIPAEYKPQNSPLQISGPSDKIIGTNLPSSNNSNVINFLAGQFVNSTKEYKGWRKYFAELYNTAKKWINQQENKGLKVALIILVGCVITMFWYLNAQFKEFQQLSQGSRENSRTGSNGKNGDVYMPEEIGEGLVRVGKIIFNTSEVLGKGCEGTFVYKGEFDGRPVAVKRLLPDCFTFADREVALLRESDAHANVVRYFCTEQDRMFRYIALELAEATLQDYVTGRYNRGKISIKNILRQATSGLAHLHFLDIVHRDIKPHNVLLSVPGPRGEIRAMISDFGLCKKLQLGRMSFSRRSGVTGTDGWIAPEMLNGERTTCAVDVFSLGCVFYYVLSGGKHPFGDTLRRQANILCGESELTALHGISESDKEIALVLIKAMITGNPTERPPASAIKNYPIFWNSAQILNFFQDISDRVEKDEPSSPALRALETNYDKVVRGDWRLHIDVEVATDLRKYRSYRGESVRDLLRALRNKKHHYRELTPEAQSSLGEIPEKFTEYWLTRFPNLLSHAWCAMQKFRFEPTLKTYYNAEYEFAYEVDEQYNSTMQNIEVRPTQSWRMQNTVDWSPNRMRFRNQRKKPDDRRKKVEEPIVWALPPSS
ncbi:serine/threonine-protein kinase/endoribonuclease IRE1 isoform X2 [Belonocnema kinseyi]|uniref:serine/threonine-protein kinase/endoribonuclease IRE1 isoform X2 n=1 Tax=Belonocnema kinseyi TaxID=2817044 RepID=UPI00143DF0DE|nr:serine/threonine-protein kinase/endoribonuclease IRE1 isoform X2 [Belonocnema kinseyi]